MAVTWYHGAEGDRRPGSDEGNRGRGKAQGEGGAPSPEDRRRHTDSLYRWLAGRVEVVDRWEPIGVAIVSPRKRRTADAKAQARNPHATLSLCVCVSLSLSPRLREWLLPAYRARARSYRTLPWLHEIERGCEIWSRPLDNVTEAGSEAGASMVTSKNQRTDRINRTVETRGRIENGIGSSRQDHETYHSIKFNRLGGPTPCIGLLSLRMTPAQSSLTCSTSFSHWLRVASCDIGAGRGPLMPTA